MRGGRGRRPIGKERGGDEILAAPPTAGERRFRLPSAAPAIPRLVFDLPGASARGMLFAVHVMRVGGFSRAGRRQVFLDPGEGLVDVLHEGRHVHAAVGGGRGQVRMAFQGEHLSHHVVVLDPAGGQRLLPCGERAAQPFAVADRVHRHQVDLRARGRAGPVDRPGHAHRLPGALRHRRPQARPVFRLLRRLAGQVAHGLLDLRGQAGRRVLALMRPVHVRQEHGQPRGRRRRGVEPPGPVRGRRHGG